MMRSKQICNSKRKRLLLGLFLIMLCWGGIYGAVCSVDTIQAYMIDKKEIINVMSVGKNEIIIEEEFEKPVKNKKTIKEPKARNSGSVDCYVRSKVVVSDSRVLPYVKYYYGNSDGFNDSDWMLSRDGWLYYHKVLKMNECSTPIFSHIELLEQIPDNLLDFSIDIIFESVQVEHFSDAEDAFYALNQGENR